MEGASSSRVRGAAGKAGRFEVTNNVDILHEVFRHLDATSLGKAACVSRKWKQATDEETLWEAICTRHWPGSASAAATPAAQLKSVVVALGGFKRLYVNCLHPLLARNAGGPPCRRPSLKQPLAATSSKWSKDEVYLSLSLFSIDCYERIAPRQTAASSSYAAFLCKPSVGRSARLTSDVRRLLDGWTAKCTTADQPASASSSPPKVDIENDNNNINYS